jgi:uncharacterized FAD-dependent dehydrogenase
MTQKEFDVAIVGAGPAGLAAAHCFTGAGFRVVMVDAGKSVNERDRHADEDITHGHGGAGLFSDGKFSFFPSASELWTLPCVANLHAAYDWTCKLLGTVGLDTPPFPKDPRAYTLEFGQWVLKHYPSDYLSLAARLALTADLVSSVDAALLTEEDVVSARYDSLTDSFSLGLRDRASREHTLTARRIILASGRFGPLKLLELTQKRSFRRLEIGFRIEQPAQHAFFRDMKQLDPKLRFREQDGGVEWRTFCACRDGEAVLTRTQGLWTVSGRSDCPPTGRSNVGFNTRILNESVAARALTPALAAMGKEDSYFIVAMNDLVHHQEATLDTFDRAYGPELRQIMVRGLFHLIAAFPALQDKETRLIGPTLEGVGWYPEVDGNLRLLDTPAWVAGDACGLFRGIVAALISGHYAAASALRELEVIQ